MTLCKMYKILVKHIDLKTHEYFHGIKYISMIITVILVIHVHVWSCIHVYPYGDSHGFK